ncbi:MAG: formamidopyrimidine-DNA glycosylase, partial [Actinomycetota bacterium]|nr:formamidopyrimidine-DNA glycosylase [Actinomycetota bacterium]
MPELPEVETIRRQLAPALFGRRLERLQVLDPRWCWPTPVGEVQDAVRGRRIDGLERRGKYLVLELSGQVFLVMHLRMTGSLLLVEEADDLPGRAHLRARFALDSDTRVLFCDVRRFGTG